MRKLRASLLTFVLFFTASVSAQAPPSRAIAPADITNTLANPISILQFGGNTALADNSSAFNQALAFHNSTGRPVFFPAGTWNFTGAITETLPSSTDSLSILGAGQGATILHFPGGGVNGITVNYLGAGNSTHWRDLSVVTAGTGGAAITLALSGSIPNPANTDLSDFIGVTIHGADGLAQSNYWANGINIASVSNINFNGISITGSAASSTGSIGINLTANSSNLGVVYNISNSILNYLDNGIYYGTYIQGVTVQATQFTGGKTGVNWPSATGTDQLVVTNSQFNNSVEGIHDNGGVQLVATGNTFLLGTNSAYGVHIITTSGVLASHNYFQQLGSATGVFGIVDEAEIYTSSFTENFFGTNTPAYWFATPNATYQAFLSNNVYVNAAPFTVGSNARVIQDTPQLFAVLPTCNSTFKGRQAFITDSTTGAYAATAAGGGSTPASVHCNSANWTVTGS